MIDEQAIRQALTTECSCRMCGSWWMPGLRCSLCHDFKFMRLNPFIEEDRRRVAEQLQREEQERLARENDERRRIAMQQRKEEAHRARMLSRWRWDQARARAIPPLSDDVAETYLLNVLSAIVHGLDESRSEVR